MKNLNAVLANDTALPVTHRHYEFDTFNKLLAHICTLFEIEAPEIVYEDGEPTITDGVIAWIKANEINMDWLFAGSPCAMLRDWSERYKQQQRFIDTTLLFEPEVRTGYKAMLSTIITHGLDVEDAIGVFNEVLAEFRAREAA